MAQDPVMLHKPEKTMGCMKVCQKGVFTPKSDQELVVLDSMDATKSSRIAKRDSVAFLRQSVEPHILLIVMSLTIRAHSTR